MKKGQHQRPHKRTVRKTGNTFKAGQKPIKGIHAVINVGKKAYILDARGGILSVHEEKSSKGFWGAGDTRIQIERLPEKDGELYLLGSKKEATPVNPEYVVLNGSGKVPRSWQAQVNDGSGWSNNAMRFGTKKEAESYVSDLMWRWLAVKETRVRRSTDLVNYRWADGKAERIE
jgi:hypothetical protein